MEKKNIAIYLNPFNEIAKGISKTPRCVSAEPADTIGMFWNLIKPGSPDNWDVTLQHMNMRYTNAYTSIRPIVDPRHGYYGYLQIGEYLICVKTENHITQLCGVSRFGVEMKLVVQCIPNGCHRYLATLIGIAEDHIVTLAEKDIAQLLYISANGASTAFASEVVRAVNPTKDSKSWQVLRACAMPMSHETDRIVSLC